VSWKIEIKDLAGIFDAVGSGVKKDILDLGIKSVKEVKFVQVYILEGGISEDQVQRICQELLTDPISQAYTICPNDKKAKTKDYITVEVAYNPGVMDPVEESTLKGIRDLGIDGVTAVRTAKKYFIKGKFSDSQLKIICEKLLYNKLIQHIVRAKDSEVKISGDAGYQFDLVTVELLKASDEKLM
jgi:phosphoribosylformylglycinamidine synthase